MFRALVSIARDNEGGLSDHQPDGADVQQWAAEASCWLHDASQVS
ncbi:hypothetical protein [Ideonella sp.]